MRTRNISILLLLVAVSALVAACATAPAQTPTTQEQTAPQTGPDIGNLAPSFSVETLDGHTMTGDQDKPTVIYFMSSSCATCARNWPILSDVYPDYADRVNFVAVSVDVSDTPAKLTSLAEEKEFTFPTAPGNPQMVVDFRVLKQTESRAITRDGRIAAKADGFLNEEEWRALFESVL